MTLPNTPMAASGRAEIKVEKRAISTSVLRDSRGQRLTAARCRGHKGLHVYGLVASPHRTWCRLCSALRSTSSRANLASASANQNRASAPAHASSSPIFQRQAEACESDWSRRDLEAVLLFSSYLQPDKTWASSTCPIWTSAQSVRYVQSSAILPSLAAIEVQIGRNPCLRQPREVS